MQIQISAGGKFPASFYRIFRSSVSASPTDRGAAHTWTVNTECARRHQRHRPYRADLCQSDFSASNCNQAGDGQTRHFPGVSRGAADRVGLGRDE